MKTLVVGGVGYIGSHVVKTLIAHGHQVTVLDNLSRGHKGIARVMPEAEYVWGDIGDGPLLDALFRKKEFQAVLHFAALSQVGESMVCPAEYYENNVVKGIGLLERVRLFKVPFFVFSSTAAVYGEPHVIPITEETGLSPSNPYGATKLAFEQALRWYGDAYGLRSISLRYFNAAGADTDGLLGEYHIPETHLIPLVLMAASGTRQYFTVFGDDYPTADGTCIRDYIHVTDLADAHLRALEALQNGIPSCVLNLGSGKGFSVQEVLEAAQRVTGLSVRCIKGERRAGDPAVLVASPHKARTLLGWQPRYENLETMIDTAWRWQQTHPQGYGY